MSIGFDGWKNSEQMTKHLVKLIADNILHVPYNRQACYDYSLVRYVMRKNHLDLDNEFTEISPTWLIWVTLYIYCI